MMQMFTAVTTITNTAKAIPAAITAAEITAVIKDMTMQYITTYQSPAGEILLTCDETGLTRLWFAGQKLYAMNPAREYEEKETTVFEEARRWLDIYFAGKEPDFMPDVHMTGSPFQLSVWKILQQIPYGQTTTYGKIAKQIAKERGISRMSAQAVGGAVGHNPISIMVPCHRVVGSDGSLTGYAGGIDKKAQLLKLEGISME